MATKQDKAVQDLFAIVQKKKSEIAKAEKPNWQTNCSFGYMKDSATGRINLQVETKIDELISILAFLIEKEKFYMDASAALGFGSQKVHFKWLGFTVSEWQADIETRINKIQITKKKQELEALETRLNSLISPEMKREMELAEITNMLKD